MVRPIKRAISLVAFGRLADLPSETAVPIKAFWHRRTPSAQPLGQAAASHSLTASARPPLPCSLPAQDFLCGLRGRDFVMVCSDTSAVQSIVTMKQDEDKLVPVDSHRLFAISGEAGDRVNFSEYIIANVRLYALRNGTQLTTKAVANYTRSELATALRKVRGVAGGQGRSMHLQGSERGGRKCGGLTGRRLDPGIAQPTAAGTWAVQQLEIASLC